MPRQIDDKYIRINGLRTNYIKAGEGGKTLLVLPGGTGPVQFYLWIVNKRLYREFTSYFINPPGFGGSKRSKKNLNVEEAADFLNEFVEKLRLKNVTVLGHSLGGSISAVFAAKHPDKVSKLVVCSPIGFRPFKLTALRLAGIILSKFFNKQFRYLIKKISIIYGPWIMLRQLIPATLSMLNNWAQTDFRPYFKAIKCPTIIIWGERDRKETSIEYLYEIKNLIPNSKGITVKGANHSFPITQPKQFQSILINNLGFLKP